MNCTSLVQPTKEGRVKNNNKQLSITSPMFGIPDNHLKIPATSTKQCRLQRRETSYRPAIEFMYINLEARRVILVDAQNSIANELRIRLIFVDMSANIHEQCDT